MELEKILNPDARLRSIRSRSGTTPPNFFPMKSIKRARELLIDALTNRKRSRLAEHREISSRAEDATAAKTARREHGLDRARSGSFNNTLNDRERYLAAQKDCAQEMLLRRSARNISRRSSTSDDLNQSERLMRQSSTNFWGGMSNRMLSSVDLVGVASGNYIGAAAETAISPTLRAARPRHAGRRTPRAGARSRPSQTLSRRSAQSRDP